MEKWVFPQEKQELGCPDPAGVVDKSECRRRYRSVTMGIRYLVYIMGRRFLSVSSVTTTAAPCWSPVPYCQFPLFSFGCGCLGEVEGAQIRSKGRSRGGDWHL